jgi:hypothetical protein
MTTGKRDIMAEAVYLAQMEAAKGTCDCEACQLLRQGNKLMTARFLGEARAAPGAAVPGSETLTLEPRKGE